MGHGGLKDDKKAQNAGEKTNEENVVGFPNDMSEMHCLLTQSLYILTVKSNICLCFPFAAFFL